METKIVARKIAMGAELRAYVARRLGFALDRSGNRVQSVTVRLADENGPRGGVDKCCSLQLALPGQPDLVVRSVAGDVRAAIDGAAHRAARALARLGRRLATQAVAAPRRNKAAREQSGIRNDLESSVALPLPAGV